MEKKLTLPLHPEKVVHLFTEAIGDERLSEEAWKRIAKANSVILSAVPKSAERPCCKECRTYEGFSCKRELICPCHNPDPTCCMKCAKMVEIDQGHFAGVCFDHDCKCHLKSL